MLTFYKNIKKKLLFVFLFVSKFKNMENHWVLGQSFSTKKRSSLFYFIPNIVRAFQGDLNEKMTSDFFKETWGSGYV